ncbi:uncharacterized protein [Oryza sativa Japonica Group]|uniref:Os05g0128300 protein n=3 Tax=Oryza TaxID=4527 RepID=Q0DL21_ORYSJ|nr:uncharacterized protein LOC4337693 [Oryza sativa Japonica Group]KAB8097947.1 hypothetical protein EE612_026857 [Oryza sativa]AAU10744.1 unknown protein [Oryza sativa Japonica Group]EEE62200.1 hypothetical protein OsJ_16987 [Oryza sativa Japonica Group]KAF2928961.1 hypothetical protein DAI22_05g021400 [Oryza sativa Japonica Group]BAF16452.1 Os05g0128300 [Oryza sativa Japonica Group]|eukprot:NP_001054538.1 Os05g0128300 [Oryza sativa Japonica Group]
MASSTLALDFLRRLLCAHAAAGNAGGGDDDGAVVVQVQVQQEEGMSPCVVARLMGLDAMPPPPPETECQPLRRQRRRRRSRSVSSAEGWPPPPAPYLKEEGDEFIVLSFSPDAASRHDNGEPDGKSGHVGAKKQSGGCPRRKLHYGGDDDDDEAQHPGHGRRRAAATERGMPSSSPVSVLHAQHSSSSSSSSSTTTTTTTTTTSSCSSEEVGPSSPSPTSEEIRLANNQQSSRRKLQPDFNDDLDNPLSPETSSCHVSKCSESGMRNRSVMNKSEVFIPGVSGTLQFICRLVEEDLNSVIWLTSDSENIAADMVSEILDQLTSETADELMQTGSETVHSSPGRLISMKHPSFRVDRNMQAIRSN